MLLEILKRELNRNLYFAHHTEDKHLRKTYFDQAYGMCVMFEALHQGSSEDVSAVWDNIRPQFEKLIWGC